MSEEHLPPPPLPPQQQQQQQQPQQSQSVQHPQQPTTNKPRLSIHELRNSDLVSRLLAATPPYLYSSPVGPHNFFFSEMLRSLVQARTNEQANRNLNNQIPLTQPGRRPRKRAWSQQRTTFEPASMNKDFKNIPLDKLVNDKPLELTNKHSTTSPPPVSMGNSSFMKYNKCESPPQKLTTSSEQSMVKTLAFDQLDIKQPPLSAEYPSNMELSNNNNSITNPSISEPTPAAIPPTDLVLPPPPPMWYPPLYPPYGIDPLHFFIDLRVSGHIYDRKKENISPTLNTTSDNNNSTTSAKSYFDAQTDIIGKHRQGSAFSVPPPRREKSPPFALNLTSTSPDKSNNYTFDHTNNSLKESSKNTNYVMQNLPRIYTNLSSQNIEERNSLNSEETDSKSDFDVQEIQENKDDRGGGGGGLDCYDSDDVVIVDNNNGKKNKNNY